MTLLLYTPPGMESLCTVLDINLKDKVSLKDHEHHIHNKCKNSVSNTPPKYRALKTALIIHTFFFFMNQLPFILWEV